MNDGEKYTSLLLRHRKLVWRLCRRYSKRDPARCAELVQDVSIALWEHFGTLRPDAGPLEEKAWVYAKTRAVLTGMHRKSRVETVPLAGWMADLIADDRDRERELARDLLEELPEADRRLMQMRLAGYDASEIGQALGLTPNAVYQRIYRIIIKLKQITNE